MPNDNNPAPQPAPTAIPQAPPVQQPSTNTMEIRSGDTSAIEKK